MNNSRAAFETWWEEKQKRLAFEGVNHQQQQRLRVRYMDAWVASWQAAKEDPDAATVALHFGYEVTTIRGEVFIAKNNPHFKVWTPFNKTTHAKLFREYDKCS